MSAIVAPTAAVRQLVPRPTATRDKVAPIIVVVSVLVHAIALLAFLSRDDRPFVAPPREIPVDVVQLPLPKPPPPAPKAPPPRPEAKAARHETPTAKPAAPRRASREAPKAERADKPKPDQAKPEAAKPEPDVAERMKRLLGQMPTAMPAVAMPGQAADGTDAISYPQLVLSKLAKAKKEGRYQGVPGRSSVAFTLGIAGQVVSVTLTRPSGDATLDEEVVAMVHRGEPYPPPPPGGQRDYAITLVFRAMP